MIITNLNSSPLLYAPSNLADANAAARSKGKFVPTSENDANGLNELQTYLESKINTLFPNASREQTAATCNTVEKIIRSALESINKQPNLSDLDKLKAMRLAVSRSLEENLGILAKLTKEEENLRQNILLSIDKASVEQRLTELRKQSICVCMIVSTLVIVDKEILDQQSRLTSNSR